MHLLCVLPAPAGEQARVVYRHTAKERDARALVQARLQKASKLTGLGWRTAGHPHHHAGIELVKATLGQVAINGKVVDAIAQILKQAAQQYMTGGAGQLTFTGVIQKRNAARHHFQRADTQ